QNGKWEKAVKEWVIIDCEEDESAESICICGHPKIRYLFTIKNNKNGNELYPIGSSCINKFERNDFNKEIKIYESMFKLYNAIKRQQRIELTSEFFTRSLFEYFRDEGVFKDSEYNNFNGDKDCEFLLDMFNKRDKSSITEKQKRKIDALIVKSIKPYLVNKLKFKNKI
ncbi:MAG: hypothetical protein IJD28_04130, partial [Deferribacterales bacterium]|nr:hypothetical protein [Deferribacterales bacterium]